MHPGSHALRASRGGCARSDRGSLDGLPAHSRTRAHPCARPYGRFRPALAAADGAQDQEHGKSKGKSCFASAFRFCAQDARALALPGDPWPCGGSGRSGPQGAREGPRAFRCCTGCAISGTRPLARTFRAGARTAQGAGACFFGSFLCTSKERNPLAVGEWKPLLSMKTKTAKARTGFPPARE